MSGNSYRGYRDRAESVRSYADYDYGSPRPSPSPADTSRSSRVHEARERVREAPPKPAARPARDTNETYDSGLIRNKITRPSEHASHVYVLLIDNSGSNRRMAEHLRKTSGYLLAMLRGIDPTAELAICYFSDHCDGEDIRQDVDFVRSTEMGDKILYSTTRHVRGADGGDAPEAIECILWDICEINFAHVPKERRHLTLVTDVVGHGMGLRGDNGCTRGRDWRKSVDRVYETFGTFVVVGCSDQGYVGTLQTKFLREERIVFDHIDLSSIHSLEHRLGICGNAFLFLASRAMGNQTAVAFLMTLYEKWLEDPIFGQKTDLAAQEAIERFLKYLEMSDEEKQAARRRIFAE